MQQQSQPLFTFEGGHMVMYQHDNTGLDAKDATVNDRDRMQDLLAQEKYLGVAYDMAMNEAGHEDLYQVFKQNHDTVHHLQRQLFQTMFQKGWYRLPLADAQAVGLTHERFQKVRSQLPFPPGHQTGQGYQTQTGQGGLSGTVEQAINQAKQGEVPSFQSASRGH